MTKRYDICGELMESETGYYVAYSDHLAEVETLRNKLLAFEGMTFSESAETSKLTEQNKAMKEVFKDLIDKAIVSSAVEHSNYGGHVEWSDVKIYREGATLPIEQNHDAMIAEETPELENDAD